MDKKIEELENRIKELESENRKLRSGKFSLATDKPTVKTPQDIAPIFDKAQEIVRNYFKSFNSDPSKGTIEINDERYILVRASALSHEFLNSIKNLYADRGEEEAFAIGKDFLFDISHVIGREDAKNFHARMNVTDPISKLSAGPVHFAYTGWAFVDILPESRPSPDENYFLTYHHPYSFEADSWIRSGIKSEFPVCTMNAGYSSGWCEESFGVELTAVEISCRAMGHKHCTFIMAPPSKINSYLKDKKMVTAKVKKYQVPNFFERKKVEEQIKSSLKEKELLLKEIHHRVKNNLQIISSLLSLQASTISDAPLKQKFKESQDRIQSMALLHESLYSNKDLSKVNSNFYFSALSNSLYDSYQKDHNKISLTIDIDAKLDRLNIDIAIPCGLIINELISNSLKYAFPDNRTGEIYVRLKPSETKPDFYNLIIGDNGIGLKKEIDFKSMDTLGLQLVYALSEQLNGKIEIKSEKGKGTEYNIEFTI